MASNQQRNFRISRLRELFGIFLESSDSEIEEALGLRRVDEAFLQLSAIKKILRVAQQEGDEIHKMTDFGRHHMALKEYGEALKCFEAALARGGASSELIILSGTAALYSHQYAAATTYAEQVLRHHPEDVQALLLKALVHITLHENTSAQTYLMKARALRPNDPIVEKYWKIIEHRHHEKTEILENRPVFSPKQEKRKTKIKQIPFKRQWARRSMKRKIYILDGGDHSMFSLDTLSLSAGGCLVTKAEIPEQFQFGIDLRSGKQVWGYGKITYTLPNGERGIKFEALSPKDQQLINEEVLRVA